MRKKIDINTWIRKDHFNFFNTFDEPFFGVTVDVDCTFSYNEAKAINVSFFLLYLYKSLEAANHIEAFKYRIINDEVWHYDQVHASATISRPDGTFGFGYMDFYNDFSEFKTEAIAEIKRVENTTGLIPASSGQNVIHYSALPWLDFKSMSHARKFSFQDSCPKISFGKVRSEGDKKIMSVSIHANHALMDGFQVSQFVDGYQQLLNQNIKQLMPG
ncbi:chloramphenicol acetyltransferase [Pedobacter punctiformis]|uniref:Chloramphenicol acetyltransferase n=1 Tax=Pedobacter punctiformis TaxID=3004097 RepID=A0ABT4LED1_9SPHI|nr:chloramphenicol acetyltransferase [Pedobacter sp. HCMS5-2]MCZ4245538.1 chloramphenicol acetyltransferase [Pedobacter sp. HCMS5-2]